MANEKRLIDANALSEKIGNMKFEITHNRGGYKYCNEDEKNEWDKLDSFDSLVCDAPTVDAVEVPCEVGHIVFFVHEECNEKGEESFGISFGEIVSFSIQKEGLWAYCRYEDGLNYFHKVAEDFGNTVFLSKEEAEEALAKMDGGNEDA